MVSSKLESLVGIEGGAGDVIKQYSLTLQCLNHGLQQLQFRNLFSEYSQKYSKIHV